MSYFVEDGMVKLAAMAPKQELARKLLVKSREMGKYSPLAQKTLETTSNLVGGPASDHITSRGAQMRVRGAGETAYQEAGAQPHPSDAKALYHASDALNQMGAEPIYKKKASYTVGDDGFIKLAASPSQSLALQSMRVSNRRPAAAGGVKRMPTIYELKQRIGAMSPADKARNRASMLKSMGIKVNKNSPIGKEWAAPAPPPSTPQVAPEPVGMTEAGDSTRGGTGTATRQGFLAKFQGGRKVAALQLPLVHRAA